MATDTKYNLDVPQIPEDEPIMLFRGKDRAFAELLHYYYILCRNAGSPESHLTEILQKRQEIIHWQDLNGDKVKAPD